MSDTRRPRETREWLLCEDTGRHADGGECPVHGGGACLIVVAWVDNSQVRRDLASAKVDIYMLRTALESVQRCLRDPKEHDRLEGVVRVVLDREYEDVASV